jgi:hypothetical protein
MASNSTPGAGRTGRLASVSSWSQDSFAYAEKLVAAGVALPHGDREPSGPGAVQLTEARIAVALGVPLVSGGFPTAAVPTRGVSEPACTQR